MKNRRADRGFTTTELLVGMVLIALVGAIAIGIVNALSRSSGNMAKQLDVEAKLVNSVVNIGTDVAASSEFEYANSDEIVVRTSAPGVTPARYVRYAFVSGKLVTSAVATLPQGFPAATAWSGIPQRTVIDGLAVPSRFTFTTRDGSPLNALPMSAAADLKKIGLVRSDVTASVVGRTVDRFGLAATKNTGIGSSPAPLTNVCTGVTASEPGQGVRLEWTRIIGVDAYQIIKNGITLPDSVPDPGYGDTVTWSNSNGATEKPDYYSVVPVVNGVVGSACDSTTFVTKPSASEFGVSAGILSAGEAPTFSISLHANQANSGAPIADKYQVIRYTPGAQTSQLRCDTSRPEQCRTFSINSADASFNSSTGFVTLLWRPSNNDTWAANSAFYVTPVGYLTGDATGGSTSTQPSVPLNVALKSKTYNSFALTFDPAVSASSPALASDIGTRRPQVYRLEQRVKGQTTWEAPIAYTNGLVLQNDAYAGKTYEFQLRTVATTPTPETVSDASPIITVTFSSNAPTLEKAGNYQGSGSSSVVSRDGSSTIHSLKLNPAPSGLTCADYQVHAISGATDTMVKTLPCNTTTFTIDNAPTDGKTIDYYVVARSVNPGGGAPLESTEKNTVTMQNAAPPLTWSLVSDDGQTAQISWTATNLNGQLGYGSLFYTPGVNPTDPNYPFTGLTSYGATSTSGTTPYYTSTGTDAVVVPYTRLPGVVGGGFVLPSKFRVAPVAPGSVAGTYTESNDSMTVTWSPGSSATDDAYRIYRVLNSDLNNATLIATVGSAARSYTDTALPGSGNIGYQVRSVSNADNTYKNSGAKQSAANGTWTGVIQRIHQPPSGLTVVDEGVGRARITWNAKNGANGYYLQRSTTTLSGCSATGQESMVYVAADGTTTSTPTVLPTNTTSVLMTQEPTTCYSYTVTSYYTPAQSQNSPTPVVHTQSGIPIPANLKVVNSGVSNQVTATWDPVSGASNYYLRRSAAPITDCAPSSVGSGSVWVNPSGGVSTSPVLTGNVTSRTLVQDPGTCYAYSVSSYFTEFPSQTAYSTFYMYSQPGVPSPTNLQVAPRTPNTVTVKWDSVPNATGYRLFRTQNPVSGCAPANATNPLPVQSDGSVNTTPYTFPNTAGTAGVRVIQPVNSCYGYQVSAVFGNGTDPADVRSAFVVFTQGTPAAPTGLTATRAATNPVNRATVSWNASPEATGYYLIRTTSTISPCTTSAANGAATTYLTDTGVTSSTPVTITGTSVTTTHRAGDCYAYSVVGLYNDQATNSSAFYPYTQPLPAAPTGLSGTKKSTTAVTISWTASPEATAYYLYRTVNPVTNCDVNGSGSVQYVTSGGGVTTTPTQLTTTSVDVTQFSSTCYSYQVQALYPSNVQSTVSAFYLYNQPVAAAPKNLTVTTSAALKVTVTWDAVPDASGYRLYRSTDPISGACDSTAAATAMSYVTSDGQIVPDVTTLTTTSVVVPNGFEACYSWQVAAVFGSDPANVRSALVYKKQPTPPAVTGLTITKSATNKVNVSWTAAPDATGYQLRQSALPCGQGSTFKYIATGGVATTSVSTIPGTSIVTAHSANICYTYTIAAVYGTNGTPTGPTSAAVNYTQPAAAAPTNLLVATTGTSQVKVTWDKPADTIRTILVRTTDQVPGCANPDPAAPTVYINSSGATTTTETVLVDQYSATISQNSNTCYSYKVRSYYPNEAPDGGNVYGEWSAFVTKSQAPAPAPTNFTVTKENSTQARASWDAVTGATGYYLYRSQSAITTGCNSNSSTGTMVYVTSNGTLTTTPTALPSGTLTQLVPHGADTCYAYQVSAQFNNDPADVRTAPIYFSTLTPVAPTGLAVANNALSNVKVTWNAVSNASGYYLERTTSAVSGCSAANAGATQYVNTDGTMSGTPVLITVTNAVAPQPASTCYAYRVSTVYPGSVVSSPSAFVLFTQATPAPPTNLAVTRASSRNATISWTGVSGADGYYLYTTVNPITGACDSTSTPGTLQYITGTGGVTSTPTVLTGTSVQRAPGIGNCHAYQVAAVYNSDPVNSRSAFVYYRQGAPLAPNGFKATPTPQSFSTAGGPAYTTDLSWNADPDASGYYVVRTNSALSACKATLASQTPGGTGMNLYVLADGTTTTTRPASPPFTSPSAKVNQEANSCHAYSAQSVVDGVAGAWDPVTGSDPTSYAQQLPQIHCSLTAAQGTASKSIVVTARWGNGTGACVNAATNAVGGYEVRVYRQTVAGGSTWANPASNYLVGTGTTPAPTGSPAVSTFTFTDSDTSKTTGTTYYYRIIVCNNVAGSASNDSGVAQCTYYNNTNAGSTPKP